MREKKHSKGVLRYSRAIVYRLQATAEILFFVAYFLPKNKIQYFSLNRRTNEWMYFGCSRFKRNLRSGKMRLYAKTMMRDTRLFPIFKKNIRF